MNQLFPFSILHLPHAPRADDAGTGDHHMPRAPRADEVGSSAENAAEKKHLNSTRTAWPPRAWEFESSSNAKVEQIILGKDCGSQREYVHRGSSITLQK